MTDQPDNAGLYHDRLTIPAGVARPGRAVRLHMAFAAAPLLAMGCGQREEEPVLVVGIDEAQTGIDPHAVITLSALHRGTEPATFPIVLPYSGERRGGKVEALTEGPYRYLSPYFADAQGNEVRPPAKRSTGKGAQRRMSKPWAGRKR